jgi:ABC-type phosphate transport system substrate-binding protein
MSASRVAALLAAALTVALAGATSAQAAFSTSACQGAAIQGIGASFQANAQAKFQQDFAANSPALGGCAPTSPSIFYDPQGSGAGRAALGEIGGTNPTGGRNTQYFFAGTDQPPNDAQRLQAEQAQNNSGGNPRADDDSPMHVFPVAVGAITITVNMPLDTSGKVCQIDPAGADGDIVPSNTADSTARFHVPSNARWEAAFAGDDEVGTWGQLIPDITGTGCAATPITRVVRTDSSGTSFAFKQWLQLISADGRTTHKWAQLQPSDTGTIGNQNWYTGGARVGNTATTTGEQGGAHPIKRGFENTGVAAVIQATPGSIGYVDLATSAATGTGTATPCTGATCPNVPGTPAPNANNTNDPTFWVNIKNGSGTFAEPTLPAGSGNPPTYKSTRVAADKGANCLNTTFNNLPSSPSDPTLGNWSFTTGMNDTGGSDHYGVCAQTYDEAFDDYAAAYNALNNDCVGNERKARTVKDYLTSALSDQTQSDLAKVDYARVSPATLAVSRAGAAAIGFDKAGTGCAATQQQQQNNNTTNNNTTNNTTTTTNSNQVPVVVPTSSDFTLASSSVAKATGVITLSLQAPKAGTFTGTANGVATYQVPGVGPAVAAKKKRKKPAKPKPKNLTYGSGSAATQSAGPVTLTIAPSAAAKSALAKGQKIAVNVTVRFTPGDGTAPTTQTRSVTVKGTKKPAKKKKKRSRR